MKKKHIRKFIALFDFLSLAGEILAGKNEQVPTADSSISEALHALQEMRNDPDNRFMVKLFDEINHNLYLLPDSRLEYYIEDILRGFVGIAPFLDCLPGTDLINPLPGSVDSPSQDLPEACLSVLKLVSDVKEDTDIDADELSDAAKYVFSCYALLLFFSKSLDARCLHFKLNLFEIQNRLGIYILHDRNYEELVDAGYEDRVFKIIFKDDTPLIALPENTATQPPSVRPFTDWLRHDNPEKLAEVCRKVFAVFQRPIDYAIMLNLLDEHQFICLPNNHRTDFYDSWYAFLGIPFPKNHNYFSINTHVDYFDEKFQVNDNTDKNYINLKGLFERKLKSVFGPKKVCS